MSNIMKGLVAIALFGSMFSSTTIMAFAKGSHSYKSHSSGDVYVHGYFRKDGTYVNGYMRSQPDGDPFNNWSFEGNINPYTGAVGTKTLADYYKEKALVSSDSSYETDTSTDIYDDTTTSSDPLAPSNDPAVKSSISQYLKNYKPTESYSWYSGDSQFETTERDSELKSISDQYGIDASGLKNLNYMQTLDLSTNLLTVTNIVQTYNYPVDQLEGLDSLSLLDLQGKLFLVDQLYQKTGTYYDPQKYTYAQLDQMWLANL